MVERHAGAGCASGKAGGFLPFRSRKCRDHVHVFEHGARSTGRAAVEIALTGHERLELERLGRRRKTGQGSARRAQIVLLAGDGLDDKTIAARLDAHPDTVGK